MSDMKANKMQFLLLIGLSVDATASDMRDACFKQLLEIQFE